MQLHKTIVQLLQAQRGLRAGVAQLPHVRRAFLKIFRITRLFWKFTLETRGIQIYLTALVVKEVSLAISG